MAKKQTTKFGIPKNVGPVTPKLLRTRIQLIERVIKAKRALGPTLKPNARPLSKSDVFKASLNLYTYRWMLKKQSTKKARRKAA